MWIMHKTQAVVEFYHINRRIDHRICPYDNPESLSEIDIKIVGQIIALENWVESFKKSCRKN